MENALPVHKGFAPELPFRPDGCAGCDVVPILDFFGRVTIPRLKVKRRFLSLDFLDSSFRSRQLNYPVPIIRGLGFPTFADIEDGGITEYD